MSPKQIHRPIFYSFLERRGNAVYIQMIAREQAVQTRTKPYRSCGLHCGTATCSLRVWKPSSGVALRCGNVKMCLCVDRPGAYVRSAHGDCGFHLAVSYSG